MSPGQGREPGPSPTSATRGQNTRKFLLMQEQFVVMARAGMARQDKTPAVGGRQMYVDHPHCSPG